MIESKAEAALFRANKNTERMFFTMNNQPNYDLVKKAVNDLIISIEKRKRKEAKKDAGKDAA